MNFNQIKRAIIAKTKDKSNMPDWYYNRLSKCVGCEFNSGNADKLSFKDRLRISHNFGKDACLKCTCGVEDKCSDPQESCPENFWGAESEVLNTQLNIVTETTKVIFSYNKKLNKYIADYKEIPYQYDSNIDLLILNEDIRDLKVSTSCGCTSAKPEVTDKGIKLNIKYDTLRVGNFEKAVRLSYKQGGIPKQTVVNIRGTVKRA